MSIALGVHLGDWLLIASDTRAMFRQEHGSDTHAGDGFHKLIPWAGGAVSGTGSAELWLNIALQFSKQSLTSPLDVKSIFQKTLQHQLTRGRSMENFTFDQIIFSYFDGHQAHLVTSYIVNPEFIYIPPQGLCITYPDPREYETKRKPGVDALQQVQLLLSPDEFKSEAQFIACHTEILQMFFQAQSKIGNTVSPSFDVCFQHCTSDKRYFYQFKNDQPLFSIHDLLMPKTGISTGNL